MKVCAARTPEPAPCFAKGGCVASHLSGPSSSVRNAYIPGPRCRNWKGSGGSTPPGSTMGYKLIQSAVSRALRQLPFVRPGYRPFDLDGDICLVVEPSPYNEKFWLVAPSKGFKGKTYQNSLSNLRNGRVQLFFEFGGAPTWQDFPRLEIPNAKETTLARVVLWAQEKYTLSQITQAE